MRQTSVKTPAGEAAILLPEPGDFLSYYVFALHKSGSSLMNDMLGAAMDIAGVPQIDIPRTAFLAGLPENQVTNAEDLIFERGYCYKGFRNFPPYLKKFDLSKHKKILLVRDPRDMLVSYYFSTAQSHFIPTQGVIREQMLKERKRAGKASIDNYCIGKIKYFKSEFDGYKHLLEGELRLYRYEDVIFNKGPWLAEMLSYFEVDVPKSEVERIAKAHDIVPAKERPGQHVRQVTPGNFRKHLSGETIERLDEAFAVELAAYEYEA